MSVSDVVVGLSLLALTAAVLVLRWYLGGMTAAVRQLQALAHWHTELPLPPALEPPETSRPTTNSGPKSAP